jgi:cytochrome c peroxidase
MHDGRYNTLDQVLDQMATGIFDGATLDPLMKTGIQLTAQQRSDLLNFLNTLNDESFIKDKRFQEQR